LEETMSDPAVLAPSISLVYSEYETAEGSKAFGAIRRVVTRIGELDVVALRRNLDQLTDSIDELLQTRSQKLTTFNLSSLEITVDITAKGEVRLIGAVSGEVKGGLKLVFSRREAAIGSE
jgi:hypothetical protein